MRLSPIVDPKLCSFAVVYLISGLLSLSAQDGQDPDFGQGEKGNQSETQSNYYRKEKFQFD